MQAARLSGARFSVLGGDIARLERALVQFFLDRHSEENGYTEMAVPYIVGRSVLEGTGQLPKFEDDLFKVNHQVNGEDGFLIPTAEVPLTNLFRESILDFGALPLSVTALTPCFRAEAGSYVGASSPLLSLSLCLWSLVRSSLLLPSFVVFPCFLASSFASFPVDSVLHFLLRSLG